MVPVAQIVRRAEHDGLDWDFYEDSAEAAQHADHTIPGRIVAYFLESVEPQVNADVALGLLLAYASRRSLACWFLYCDDITPLVAVNGVEHYWVDSPNGRLHEEWLAETIPRERGVPIVDCRWQDTSAASSAVAHAARYAHDRCRLDAITALSHAFIAFDVSPLGEDHSFIPWLTDIAAQCALEYRKMTLDEQFALARFPIPPAIRNAM